MKQQKLMIHWMKVKHDLMKFIFQQQDTEYIIVLLWASKHQDINGQARAMILLVILKNEQNWDMLLIFGYTISFDSELYFFMLL